MRDLLSHGVTTDLANVLQELANGTPKCRMCEVQAEVERRALSEIAKQAKNAVTEKSNVKACCLPHLFLVIHELGAGEATQLLLLAHIELLERIAEDLQRYTLKHYGVRRYLASEEERRASKLALLLLDGHHNVVISQVGRSLL